MKTRQIFLLVAVSAALAVACSVGEFEDSRPQGVLHAAAPPVNGYQEVSFTPSPTPAAAPAPRPAETPQALPIIAAAQPTPDPTPATLPFKSNYNVSAYPSAIELEKNEDAMVKARVASIIAKAERTAPAPKSYSSKSPTHHAIRRTSTPDPTPTYSIPEKASALATIQAAGVPPGMATLIVDTRSASQDGANALSPGQRETIDRALSELNAGSAGAGLGGAIALGLSLFIIGVSSVGLLIAWLLTAQKQILQCSRCGAVTPAS